MDHALPHHRANILLRAGKHRAPIALHKVDRPVDVLLDQGLVEAEFCALGGDCGLTGFAAQDHARDIAGQHARQGEDEQRGQEQREQEKHQTSN